METSVVIVIGIDPHKSSLTAVAVDDTGHELAARRFVVNAGTFTQLISWAQRWPQHRFAVEGAKGLGRGIAQQLAAAGAGVVDVPATLAARARLLTEHRDDLTHERTRILNRLHGLLRDLVPGGAPTGLSADKPPQPCVPCDRPPPPTPADATSPGNSWPHSGESTHSSRQTKPN
ncbi:IS110 family transposase [Salinispora pacifica]|uniref:IS110 family transposase n=1 Tax=Salinispora pacifica TaxID=351187 RepID=UPI001EE2D976|nr:IS110 family transposase [Salinispora pacifica]